MIEIDPDYGAYCECNVNMERAHGKTNVAVCSLSYVHHTGM